MTSSQHHTLIIAFGANLGAREETISRALAMLTAYDITVTATSSCIETEPLLLPETPPQPPYLNGVCTATTAAQPTEVLQSLMSIEAALGRVRGSTDVRWGPRLIDLDLIAYDDLVLTTPDLILPHAEMHRRAFVLEPLVQIAPDWVHPVLGKSARELLLGVVA